MGRWWLAGERATLARVAQVARRVSDLVRSGRVPLGPRDAEFQMHKDLRLREVLLALAGEIPWGVHVVGGIRFQEEGHGGEEERPRPDEPLK